MDKKQIAINYLNNDILKNCDLLTFLKIYDDIEFVYSSTDGVCFNLTSKNITCVSTENRDVSKLAASHLENVENCICKSSWDFEVFNEKFNFKNHDECFQYIYSKDENFNQIENVKLLSKSNISEMKANFSIEINENEIADLMEKFNFYGYFLDDKIVGIIGRHIDGEIGFLEVLENYRNQGIATALTKTIINENCDIIPFSQVVTSNYKSINLQKKLGAIQNPTTVFWCYSDNY